MPRTMTGFVLLILLFAANCSNPKSELPAHLGNLTLSKVVRGEEAQKILVEMHGKSLGTDDYVIGYYGAETDNNILYISKFNNPELAREDLLQMTMRMAGGTPVFSPLQFEGMSEDGTHTVFRTEGMGFSHFFYRDGSVLVWWQVQPFLADETYRDLQQFSFDRE